MLHVAMFLFYTILKVVGCDEVLLSKFEYSMPIVQTHKNKCKDMTMKKVLDVGGKP